ncbi:hypothetical protein HETIRDRAFT_449051 [Heterobasidion irregulare TC 32-1]|uniref:Uncharacterized protein n=1 Tax=Heterobasidion irregulare (strain TC 32-1) TaxID=747525 RepID=W4KM64_HETIT|nr:uncharacterized protein HETIRDRAFT_449051 [Heterobasidion irregulare TC 32-1]ETW86156.1 hypothetical protein HETIRDRAFT_449051 [Heterobasidion irregulare TC 32-1]
MAVRKRDPPCLVEAAFFVCAEGVVRHRPLQWSSPPLTTLQGDSEDRYAKLFTKLNVTELNFTPRRRGWEKARSRSQAMLELTAQVGAPCGCGRMGRHARQPDPHRTAPHRTALHCAGRVNCNTRISNRKRHGQQGQGKLGDKENSGNRKCSRDIRGIGTPKRKRRASIIVQKSRTVTRSSTAGHRNVSKK